MIDTSQFGPLTYLAALAFGAGGIVAANKVMITGLQRDVSNIGKRLDAAVNIFASREVTDLKIENLRREIDDLKRGKGFIIEGGKFPA